MFLKDTCLTYVQLLSQLDERPGLGGPQKFQKNSHLIYIVVYTSKWNPDSTTHKKQIIVNHVFIYLYIYMYLSINIIKYVYVEMYLCMYTDEWIDGYIYAIQRFQIYVNTIQRSWIPGFASLSCYARTHARTHALTHKSTRVHMNAYFKNGGKMAEM